MPSPTEGRAYTAGYSRRNASCALVGTAVSPLAPVTCRRHNHQRGRHAPGAALARRLLPCPAALPPARRCMLDFLLRFHMGRLAQLLDRCRRCQTHSSIACRSLLPAPFPDQGSFPRPALPGFIGTATLSATPRDRFRASRRHRWPAPLRQPLRGASRVAHVPSSAHAVATTPAEPLGVHVVLLPQRRRPPRIPGGSASALPFSRPARRSLLVTACALAESLRTLFHRKLQPLRCLRGRSDCYRLERPSPGGIRTHWDRAPLHGTLRNAG